MENVPESTFWTFCQLYDASSTSCMAYGHWPKISNRVENKTCTQKNNNKNNVWVIKFSDRYKVKRSNMCIVHIVHFMYEPLKRDDLILVSATKKIPSPQPQQKNRNSGLCVCVCECAAWKIWTEILEKKSPSHFNNKIHVLSHSYNTSCVRLIFH